MAEDLISLIQFAELHGIAGATARQNAKNGKYKSARKIGRNWVIDRNEPIVDRRIKSGEYVGWRQKYGKSEDESR